MAMSGEELQKLGNLFKDLGVKPDLTSKEEFQTWMADFTQRNKPAVKTESQEIGHTEHLKFDHNRPRLPIFNRASEKVSIPYGVWRYEVECILKDELYTLEVVTEAFRRSLKGEAAKVSMRLGSKSSIQGILHKLDGLYGKVATEGTLLTQFYAAQQHDKEDVTSWSCRLEEIIQGVHAQGLISRGTMYEMLRSKLWSGLRDEKLKNATHYKYDMLKDYDQLVIAIRKVEQESVTDKVKATSKVIQKPKEVGDGKLQEIIPRKDSLERTLNQFSSRLQKIETSMEQVKSKIASMERRTEPQQPYRLRPKLERGNTKGSRPNPTQTENKL